MDKTKGLLTLEEAARYLGASKISLRRWTNEGRLACHRIGARRERRFDIRMLNDFLAQGDAGAPGAQDSDAPAMDRLGEYAKAGVQRHVCLFYRDPEEQWQLSLPYLLDHLKAGNPTVYICDSSSKADVLARLRDEGVNGEKAIESGLLRLHLSRDTHLKTGQFSADMMIETMRGFFGELIAAGTDRQLLVGEMSWFFTNSPGVDEIHDYESRLNELLDQLPSITVVCHYDLSRFSAYDALQACRSHPVVQIGNHLLSGLSAASQRGLFHPE